MRIKNERRQPLSSKDCRRRFSGSRARRVSCGSLRGKSTKSAAVPQAFCGLFSRRSCVDCASSALGCRVRFACTHADRPPLDPWKLPPSRSRSEFRPNTPPLSRGFVNLGCSVCRKCGISGRGRLAARRRGPALNRRARACAGLPHLWPALRTVRARARTRRGRRRAAR